MKRLIIAFVVLLVAGLLGLAFFAGDWRDWAEIRLDSIETTPEGQVTAKIALRYSNGAETESIAYVDGVPGGGARGRSRGLPFTVPRGGETMTFSLNPERVPVTGKFTDSELFKRLLMRVGETRSIRAGETLSLYDFTAGGKRYQCVYRVIPRDEPDSKPVSLPR